jgi:osmotically-inducible protein OsmY
VPDQPEFRKLLDDVDDALRWDPRADSTNVSVAMLGGTAILKGSVCSLNERWWCEQIIKRVRGVTSICNKIQVRLTIGDYRTDETLRRVIGELFEAMTGMPPERPHVTVRNGCVTLRGSVRRPYQKQLPEQAVRRIAGVRGLTNFIRITGDQLLGEDVKPQLETELSRRLPECSIRVRVADARIVLRGTVRTCAERDDVIDLAWCAAGVASVDDRIVVRP